MQKATKCVIDVTSPVKFMLAVGLTCGIYKRATLVGNLLLLRCYRRLPNPTRTHDKRFWFG